MKNSEMKKVLYANTHKYVIEEGSLQSPDNVLLALTINKKLETYGVVLDASAIRALSTQTAAEMSKTWSEMEEIIRDVNGINDFNGSLFYPNFPEEVMDKSEAELYLNSLFYYTFAQTNDELSLAIANEIRNMVTKTEQSRLPLFEDHPRDLRIINKGTEDDLFKMMHARIHSLNMSEQQFNELELFSQVYREKFDEMLSSETPFQSKETKVKIAMMLHDSRRDGEIKLLLRDAVDVLRFSAMLSKRNGMDQNTVELKSTDPNKQVAFKLKNDEKRLVRSLLSHCDGLYTDIWHQERLFKSLMNRLGTTAADGCPARVVRAFDNLAKGNKVDAYNKPIFNANKLIGEGIEEMNATGNTSKLETVAKNRPGDFLRSYISTISKLNPEYRDTTIDMVKHCANSNSVPLKNVLTVKEQLRIDANAMESAAAGEPIAKVYKHHGKHYAKANNGVNLTKDNIEKMNSALFDTAAKMVAGYQTLGKVYIDPELANVKAPGREMRDASGGSVLTPYSTIQMDKNKNLMVCGIRWEPTKSDPNDKYIDVDLSVHMYNKDYQSIGHVDYTNLKNHMAVHSGDYTSIPNSGSATEAIVIDKERLKQHGAQYLVAEVHCYSIESFRKAGNCKFVYEQKEGSLSNHNTLSQTSNEDGNVVFLGKVFEPSHLENCVTLNSDAMTSVPFVYDVEKDMIYWLDAKVNRTQYGMLRVTNNPYIMGNIVAEIEIAKNNPYPDVKSLVECYAVHNGEITNNILEADTVFVRNHIDPDEIGLKENARVVTGFDLDIISKEFSGNDDQSIVQENIKQEQEQPEQVEENKKKEPALIKQLRYLHAKLDAFPRGRDSRAVEFFNDPHFGREK